MTNGQYISGILGRWAKDPPQKVSQEATGIDVRSWENLLVFLGVVGQGALAREDPDGLVGCSLLDEVNEVDVCVLHNLPVYCEISPTRSK